MKRAALTLALRLCRIAIRVNDCIYDNVTDAAHALIRLAGRVQCRIDAILMKHLIVLSTYNSMPHNDDAPTPQPPKDEPASSSIGERVFGIVFTGACIFCVLAFAGDLQASYAEHLSALWSVGSSK